MSKHEIIGNYERIDRDVMSRREVLLMGAMAAATGIASATPVIAAAAAGAVTGIEYAAKDYSALKVDGLSASQIEQHIKLYKGYITKANELGAKLKDVTLEGANATYAPLRELLVEESYAVNGVVYHEYYFGNLGGKGGEASGELRAALEDKWGSYAKFMDYLKAAGKCMRGWVIVGWNTRVGQLQTFGLDMHNMWAPANVVPIVVLDVYEHAYMIDFGIDRAKYLDVFVKNLDWDVVGKRLAMAKKHPSGPDCTA